jgi:DNA-binding response OmpR family regulator
MANPVLIIEDDPDIAEGLRYNLELEKLETRVALTGEEGLSASLDQDNPPSLVLLDLLLPGMNGLEICRRLRREALTRRTPIIMLTAKASDADIAAGFALGADDYITKPFSVHEVMARIRALLLRVETNPPQTYDDGRLRIDFAALVVSCNGRAIKLTTSQFGLLAELAMHPGKVLPQQQLIDTKWGKGHYADFRMLDLEIGRLCRHFDGCRGVIETMPGVGYRFVGCGASENSPGPGQK